LLLADYHDRHWGEGIFTRLFRVLFFDDGEDGLFTRGRVLIVVRRAVFNRLSV
jgi:hypothetical protein